MKTQDLQGLINKEKIMVQLNVSSVARKVICLENVQMKIKVVIVTLVEDHLIATSVVRKGIWLGTVLMKTQDLREVVEVVIEVVIEKTVVIVVVIEAVMAVIEVVMVIAVVTEVVVAVTEAEMTTEAVIVVVEVDPAVVMTGDPNNFF